MKLKQIRVYNKTVYKYIMYQYLYSSNSFSRLRNFYYKKYILQ